MRGFSPTWIRQSNIERMNRRRYLSHRDAESQRKEDFLSVSVTLRQNTHGELFQMQNI